MVEAVAEAGFTPTLKTAVITGLVGTVVGGTDPFRSIDPAFMEEIPKVVTVLDDFLQLVIPTKSIIASSNELRISICFLITSFILS
jgi:hypothetical protein